jgi:hypothetical protein
MFAEIEADSGRQARMPSPALTRTGGRSDRPYQSNDIAGRNPRHFAAWLTLFVISALGGEISNIRTTKLLGYNARWLLTEMGNHFLIFVNNCTFNGVQALY